MRVKKISATLCWENGLDRSKVESMKFTEWVIASHVEKPAATTKPLSN